MNASILGFMLAFHLIAAQPTIKTCTYLCDLNNVVMRDSIVKNFELIIAYDYQRSCIPIIKNEVYSWRRGRPILLVYKGCLTLFDSNSTKYGYRYDRENISGGGHTVGGFYYWDSLYNRNKARCFLRASIRTKNKDTKSDRVKAGGDDTWKFRWAMDYGNKAWAMFFAQNTKKQCLINYQNLQNDSTFFDGVFIDHILHDPDEYDMYPQKYAVYHRDTLVGFNAGHFQNDIYRFLKIVYREYHNLKTPKKNPSQIIAVGNCNNTYLLDTLLWKKYMQQLDGGMEENFARTGNEVTVEKWKNMIWEMQYNESRGKIFMALKKVQAKYDNEKNPFGVIWFDSTQMVYGLTSYLMGCDSMSFFGFGADYLHHFWSPIMNIDIGKPLGNYLLSKENLAFRFFEKAVVVVNPTNIKLWSRNIGKNMLLIGPEGTVIDTIYQITLPPHTGAICLRPMKE